MKDEIIEKVIDRLLENDEEANTFRIGKMVFTTDSPYSSYGNPVLLINSKPYGPEDDFEGELAGSVVVTSDALNMAGVRGIPELPEKLDIIKQWLGQSAQHGTRWVQAVDRAVEAKKAEFPDEE